MGTHKIFYTRYFDVNKQHYEIFQTTSLLLNSEKYFCTKNVNFSNPTPYTLTYVVPVSPASYTLFAYPYKPYNPFTITLVTHATCTLIPQKPIPYTLIFKIPKTHTLPHKPLNPKPLFLEHTHINTCNAYNLHRINDHL